MTTPASIDEAIEQNALNPRRVQVGNQSVEMPSVDDQIKARNDAAAADAATRTDFGLRFRKIIPPGCG
jgi:hypothetical protein